ncbi:glycosyl transferase family 10 (putative fucosyltransferase) [Aminobacter aminovorans]|uniref:Glycosyltransferase family 10 (Fucosyltransferase) n=1 Tax=Aminobacter aminovorans TaxID=83263 RepID=A0A380WE41_AMIAI|nr:glycosyltransferase family 10 [Aminobacter aminovorans]TCS23407.1 glycosyl transferase family 10 (putative fucosyltransferase) [Aminobacter aminovorans]SUU87283.1 Glycosyltransferase family 10 (fucosyltransferase) [Aminobacter aminovorans]
MTEAAVTSTTSLPGQVVVNVHCCHFWQDMPPRRAVETYVAPWARACGIAIEYCDELDKADLVLIGPFAPKNQNVAGTRMPDVAAGDYERVFLTGENATPLMDHCEWALAFDYEADIGNERYMRYPLYVWSSGGDSILHWLAGLPSETPEQRAARPHFCAFIYGNKRAKLRRWLFRGLSLYRRVDAPGRVQRNCAPIGNSRDDKLAFLRKRRFTIAFENSSAAGYTTEKLVDAMLAGSVPIYWGNPRVAEDFDERCFINWHAHEKRICDRLAFGWQPLARSHFMRKLATPLTLISVARRTVAADRNPALFEAFFAQSPLTENSRKFLNETAIAGRWEKILQAAQARAMAKQGIAAG